MKKLNLKLSTNPKLGVCYENLECLTYSYLSYYILVTMSRALLVDGVLIL